MPPSGPGDDRADLDVGRVQVYALSGASVTYHNGRGINVDTLTATPATIGQTWTASLGVAGPHRAGQAYLAIHRSCRAGLRMLGAAPSSSWTTNRSRTSGPRRTPVGGAW
jgi:hypothetical protein